MARRFALLLLALAMALPSAGHGTTAARLIVRHPSMHTAGDHRSEYPVAVLRLALERAGAPADIVPSTVAMEQERAIRALSQGQLIDVMWTVSTSERERRLQPIRIPIDRGLIGWRVLAVRRDDLARFRRIREVGELATLVGAQGHDWPDLAILQANGLRTLASPSYDSLFELLRRGRIDYVARGAGEIVPELGERDDRGLAVEPLLLLHYPAAQYFFVRPGNDALASVIERGLRRALDDGSLDVLFNRTFGPDLDQLDLAGRQRLRLANPQLPSGTPLSHPRWWYQPEAEP